MATAIAWFPGSGVPAAWTATMSRSPWPERATMGPGSETTSLCMPDTVMILSCRRSVAAATHPLPAHTAITSSFSGISRLHSRPDGSGAEKWLTTSLEGAISSSLASQARTMASALRSAMVWPWWLAMCSGWCTDASWKVTSIELSSSPL